MRRFGVVQKGSEIHPNIFPTEKLLKCFNSVRTLRAGATHITFDVSRRISQLCIGGPAPWRAQRNLPPSIGFDDRPHRPLSRSGSAARTACASAVQGPKPGVNFLGGSRLAPGVGGVCAQHGLSLRHLGTGVTRDLQSFNADLIFPAVMVLLCPPGEGAMPDRSQYLQNAKECRALARTMSSPEDREKLENMAKAWEALAAEARRKADA